MKEVDEDAWAAVRRVLDWKRPTLTASEANDLTTVLSLLPEALTNPQPALPTEPGAFLDRYSHAVQLDEEGRWWYGTENYDPSGAGPFTRLVPERPQVTAEQITKVADLADSWDETVLGILALVYGTTS